jgi:flagellar hook-length control protein FliK
VAQPTPGQANFGQSDADADDASSDSSHVADATPTPNQSFAGVASTAAQRGEQASDVKPAHVVSQIAHQADLYRLPGGRGVRIQLHPDDLGGVGVTIKYGATGGLELHINVEHAATAQLVQSGWNDLRNALSLQGIAPERLIMSVSGPTDASLSDSSTGYRSDTGQTSFGQTGQQRQDHDNNNNNEARASRGWTSFGDAPSSATDDVRTTSAPSNSRIDYRV